MMKCANCRELIKECGCGLGHGYIHVQAPTSEQIHRCWPEKHAKGLVPGRSNRGKSPLQGRQQTFAEPR